MDRRRFLLTSLAGALAGPLAAEAQPTRGMPARIGVLSGYARGNVLGADAFMTAVPYQRLLQGAVERGYSIGQTVVLELRGAQDQVEKLDAFAADLVQRNVDVLLTDGTLATQAAQRATHTIPIVMIRVGDPIGDRLIQSLARPGGNITGVAGLAPESYAKAVQLLKEAVPHVGVVGVWWNPRNSVHQRATVAVEKLGPNSVSAWCVLGSLHLRTLSTRCEPRRDSTRTRCSSTPCPSAGTIFVGSLTLRSSNGSQP